MEDKFETAIPAFALKSLLRLGKETGFDPTASLESEKYFRQLVEQFRGNEIDFERWLREWASVSFKCAGERPRWLQNPAWVFSESGPMTFVGQVDLRPGLFHDSASFYIFYDVATGVTRNVIQVA